MLRIPVLMYHHIAADREVTPCQFEDQLKYLKDKGYRTPDLREFDAILTGAVYANHRKNFSGESGICDPGRVVIAPKRRAGICRGKNSARPCGLRQAVLGRS